MQKLPSMQRSGTFKTLVGLFLIFTSFVLYVSLTDIYAILPPLFGILFLSFCAFWQKGDYYAFFLVVVCLLWLELDKNLTFGSLLACFFLLYFLLYRPMASFLTSSSWVDFFHIVVIYVGFGLMSDLSHLNLWDFILLFGGYILIEGVILWLL